MLKELHFWLNRYASARLLVLLLMILIPLLLALNFVDLPFSIPRIKALSGGVSILDLEFYYSVDTAYRHLTAYGPEGRRLYAWGLLTVDMVLPALMFLTLAVALTLTGRRQAGKSWLPLLNLLPLIVMVSDYLENAAILTMLGNYPHQLIIVGTLSGIFTLSKQVSTLACLALILWGNVRAWWNMISVPILPR